MGFTFSEVMQGTYRSTAAPGIVRFMAFDVVARAPSFTEHVRNGGRMDLVGTLHMENFVTAAPVTGSLQLAPFLRRFIGYDLSFRANGGRRYRFTGKKTIKLRGLRRSWTSLPGTVTDAQGKQYATTLLQFDLAADWLQFLASWRLT